MDTMNEISEPQMASHPLERLAVLIREGCQDNRQIRWVYADYAWDTSNQGQDRPVLTGTCALGAAVYAVGRRQGLAPLTFPQKEDMQWKDILTYLEQHSGVSLVLVFPDDRQYEGIPESVHLMNQPLWYWIIYLNDILLWSRETIADWLLSPVTKAAYDAAFIQYQKEQEDHSEEEGPEYSCAEADNDDADTNGRQASIVSTDPIV